MLKNCSSLFRPKGVPGGQPLFGQLSERVHVGPIRLEVTSRNLRNWRNKLRKAIDYYSKFSTTTAKIS